MRRDALFLGLIVLAAVTAIAYLGVRGQALEASHDFRPRPDASFAAARAQLDAAFQEIARNIERLTIVH